MKIVTYTVQQRLWWRHRFWSETPNSDATYQKQKSKFLQNETFFFKQENSSRTKGPGMVIKDNFPVEVTLKTD